MKQTIPSLLILFLIIPAVSADIIINEIMYNPSTCSDKTCEWIELTNNGEEQIDLTGWALCGERLLPGYVQEYTTINNKGMILNSNEFAIITNEGTNVFTQNTIPESIIPLHISKSALCGRGLTNTEKTITLTDKNGTNTITTYNSDFGANGNGKTLEWSGTNWAESLNQDGTPGEQNSITGAQDDVTQIIINEFFPAPIGNDNDAMPNGEWVELHNPTIETIDVRGMILYDQNDGNELYISNTNTISTTLIPADSYLTVYRNGDSDFNLNNNGYDEVRLFDGNGNLIDSVSYSSTTEGMSWNRIQGTWQLGTPTPDAQNNAQGSCNWKLNINFPSSIFSSKNDVEWDTVLQKEYGQQATVSVKGDIQDLFGQIVKTYAPWTDELVTTTRTTSYSPILNKDVYIITFWIDSISCADDNQEDNTIQKLIVINPEYKRTDSSVEIKGIQDLGRDEIAEWGDTIRIETAIYKGNTTKNVIEVRAEEKDGSAISKTSKVTVTEKYTTTNTTIPIVLYPNCDMKREDGDYIIKIKGLGEEADIKLEVRGHDKGMCDQGLFDIPKKPTPVVQKIDEVDGEIPGEDTNEDTTTEITQTRSINAIGRVVYTSSSWKAKELAPWIFIVALILLTILLTFKKI